MFKQELDKSCRQVHDAVYQRSCGSEFDKLLLADTNTDVDEHIICLHLRCVLLEVFEFW